ncbi:MAG: hypothetical protein ACOC93_05940 [Planctomycetota bacterium]
MMTTNALVSGAIVAVLLAALAGPGLAQQADPNAAAQEVLQAAPAGTVGVVHADAQAAGKLLSRAQAAIENNQDLPAEVVQVTEGLGDVIGQVRAVEVYIVVTQRGDGWVALIHTDQSAEQLVRQIAKLLPEEAEAKPQQTQPGYWRLSPQAPLMLIDAEQVDAVSSRGVLVTAFPQPQQSAQVLQSWGAGAALDLSKVDTAAPVWATWDIRPMMQSGWLAIYPQGEKTSQMRAYFAPGEQGNRMTQQVARQVNAMLGDAVTAQAEGQMLKVSTTFDQQFFAELSKALARARRAAEITVSGTNLKGLATAIRLYTSDHGQLPPDLEALVTDGLVSPKMLFSPASGREPELTEDGELTNEPDYVYLRRPKDHKADHVLVYEPPKLWDGEGGNVAYADGNVEWLSAEKLREAVERTKKTIEQNE